MYGPKRFRLATAVIFALVLTIALAPAVVAQTTPNPPPPNPPANGTPASTPEPPSPNRPLPPSPTSTLPSPPGETPTATATADNGTGTGNGGMMPPSAPAWPPPGLIVTHAATQVQLAPVGDGLQTYFIGADGTGHSGPFINSLSSLAQQHPAGGAVSLFSGTNPGTGKSINIYYLPTEMKLRISTYYPDTQYDINKPYVFTVDSGHNVVHEQW